MAKDIEFEFVDTKKKFLNVFLSKKIAYINKLRAAFGAWRRLVAYRRLMNESDDDSDMLSLVYSSDMSSDSECDFVFDPAFDMKNAAKLDVSYYVVITVGDLLQRRRRATPSSNVCGLAADDGNVFRLLLMAATFLSLPRSFTRFHPPMITQVRQQEAARIPLR